MTSTEATMMEIEHLLHDSYPALPRCICSPTDAGTVQIELADEVTPREAAPLIGLVCETLRSAGRGYRCTRSRTQVTVYPEGVKLPGRGAPDTARRSR